MGRGEVATHHPGGNSGYWSGWAWQQSKSLLQKSQRKGEAQAHPGGGMCRGGGGSVQQNGGHVHAGGLDQLGAYTVAGCKITWALWKAEPYHFKFLVQSVYNVIPSPANLFTWGLVESPACQLCQKRGSLELILSCCSKALGHGQYCWRYNQVLQADTIAAAKLWLVMVMGQVCRPGNLISEE